MTHAPYAGVLAQMPERAVGLSGLGRWLSAGAGRVRGEGTGPGLATRGVCELTRLRARNRRELESGHPPASIE